MKIFALAAIAIAMTMTTGAYAQEDKGTCKVQATTGRDKPLAGAALTSFMKKCQDDAQKACDAQAAEKKLNSGQDELHQEMRDRRHRRLSRVPTASHRASRTSRWRDSFLRERRRGRARHSSALSGRRGPLQLR